MPGRYRISRNIEASVIDYIKEVLNATGGWTDINITKTFAKVEGLDLPVLCIRCGVTSHEKVELGGNSTIREVDILIDIFAENDGQRLDLKDWVIENIKAGIPYYEYIITNGVVTDKTLNGRIRIVDIDDTPIDFDVPKNELEVPDRYRHSLVLTASLGRVEA